MDTLESVMSLLDSVPSDDIECRASGMDYFRRSIADFIDDPSDNNAEKVYTFFSGLYRLSDEKDNPLVDMMDVMHSYEVGASRFTEKHRDHYIHSINVFLLGVEVYENCSRVRDVLTSCYGNGSFTTTDGSFLFTWGNASLFHTNGNHGCRCVRCR